MPEDRRRETSLRILFIQGVARYGGALRSLLHTMRLLKRAGGYPILVTSREGRLTEECRAHKIAYETVPMGMWRKVKSWPLFPVVFFRLTRLILDNRVDLIHCNTLWDAPYGILLGWITRRPVTVHLRNVHSENLVSKYHINLARSVVGVSFECLKHLNPEIRRRSHTIYNPWEESPQITPAGDFSISLIGRLDTTKGQREFVERVYLPITGILNLGLDMVGGASAKEKFLEEEAKGWERTLPLLKYRGQVKEIHRFYKKAMFIVIPSLPSALEGVPRVAIEAFSFGRCAVATDSGGTKEAVFEKTGVLVGQVEEMKRPVVALSMIPRLRRKLGVNAQRFVEKKMNPQGHIESLIRIWQASSQGEPPSQGERYGETCRRG